MDTGTRLNEYLEWNKQRSQSLNKVLLQFPCGNDF